MMRRSLSGLAILPLLLSVFTLSLQAKPSTNIGLGYFTLTATDEGVKIDWRTESEFGTVGYYIERSADDSPFSQLTNIGNEGFIAAYGGSSPAIYSVIDDSAMPNVSYAYRLIEIESDGSQNIIAEKVILVSTQHYYYLPWVAN